MDRTEARGLALIDRQLENTISLAPAEYEIARRVILATGDLDYRSILRFSKRSLEFGVAALAARTPIVVDTPMVRAGILPRLQETFVNLVYCPNDSAPEQDLESLARRYPEGIFAFGQSAGTLLRLVAAIEKKECQPALVIATPTGFVDTEIAKEKLRDSGVPNISIANYKGGASVAVAIVNALADLAREAYR
jgi:precorrin-8X/cobalt-precorrin-8 methylmutase